MGLSLGWLGWGTPWMGWSPNVLVGESWGSPTVPEARVRAPGSIAGRGEGPAAARGRRNRPLQCGALLQAWSPRSRS